MTRGVGAHYIYSLREVAARLAASAGGCQSAVDREYFVAGCFGEAFGKDNIPVSPDLADSYFRVVNATFVGIVGTLRRIVASSRCAICPVMKSLINLISSS